MLRFDISGTQGQRTHYITPFVSDGHLLYVFDEPSHDPAAVSYTHLTLPTILLV